MAAEILQGKEVVFNINNDIKVKLDERGFLHYRDYHNQYLPEDMVRPLDYFKAMCDSDGYIKFQAWHFIQIFGSTIRQWEKPMFALDIIIVFPDSTEEQIKKLTEKCSG